MEGSLGPGGGTQPLKKNSNNTGARKKDTRGTPSGRKKLTIGLMGGKNIMAVEKLLRVGDPPQQKQGRRERSNKGVSLKVEHPIMVIKRRIYKLG